MVRQCVIEDGQPAGLKPLPDLPTAFTTESAVTRLPFSACQVTIALTRNYQQKQAMKLKGKIHKWNDERGFGFIKPDAGDGEVFFHIKSFRNSSARPKEGMAVHFELTEDSQGRKQASHVRVAGSAASVPTIRAFIVTAIFLSLVGALAHLGYLPKAVLWLYLGASALSFLLYQKDKSAAEKGKRRTPEATLHNFALIGGWPGALFAQQLLRHKSRKASFRRTFWMTVFLNVTALGYLLSPHGSQIASEINRIFG